MGCDASARQKNIAISLYAIIYICDKGCVRGLGTKGLKSEPTIDLGSPRGSRRPLLFYMQGPEEAMPKVKRYLYRCVGRPILHNAQSRPSVTVYV